MSVKFEGELETDLKRFLAELRAGLEQLQEANEKVQELELEKDGYKFDIRAAVGYARGKTHKEVSLSFTEADLMAVRKVIDRDKFGDESFEEQEEDGAVCEEPEDAEEVAESPDVDPDESVADTVRVHVNDL